jgi:predicted nucleic acid-binding Zn ribbon protein
MNRPRGDQGRAAGDEPTPLRDALAGVGRELGLPEPTRLTTLLDAWPDIVGADLAPHAHVRSLRDGVLVVGVDAPAFATQVKYLEAHVRDRASDLVGRGVVRSLRVVVNPARKPG